MTEQELIAQQTIARANLRLLDRRGGSDAEIAKLTAIMSSLAKAAPVKAVQEEKLQTAVEKIDVAQLPIEVRQRIEQLTNERNGIHAEKSRIANELHTVPEHINCRNLTSQILTLRDRWGALNDKIREVMVFGLATTEAVIDNDGRVVELPEDAEILRFRINQHQSNINKASKRNLTLKDTVLMTQNRIKIARWTGEIDLLKAKLAAVK